MDRSFFLAMLALFCSCGDRALTIKVYDEKERLQEEYQIHPEDSIRHGNYRSFHNNGQVYVEGTYYFGRLDGPHKLYHPNGTLEREEYYEDGTIVGVLNAYYDNGQLQQTGRYVNGEMEGTWKGFYRNGQLKEEVHFERSNENGPFVEFHDNGELKARGTYRNGDYEHGLLELFNESGNLERKMMCDMGICETIWTRDSL